MPNIPTIQYQVFFKKLFSKQFFFKVLLVNFKSTDGYYLTVTKKAFDCPILL